jgi:circadian clock protein KaiC
MHIGKPFRDVAGILAGNPQHIAPGEMERLSGLFKE